MARFESAALPGVSLFRNRAYDSRTGRWTQEDPIGVAGGLNLYQFNGNDPVAYTDPFGLCPWCIGAAAGVVTGFAIATLTGDDYSLKDAAVDAALGAVGGGLVSKLDKLNDLRKAAKVADKVADATQPSAGMLRSFSEQLARDGRGSVEKSIRSLSSELVEHIQKAERIKAAGRNAGSVEVEISNYRRQIEAAKRILQGDK